MSKWRTRDTSEKCTVAVDDFCAGLREKDLKREMRLRVRKLDRFREYSGVGEDDGLCSSEEELIKKAENYS